MKAYLVIVALNLLVFGVVSAQSASIETQKISSNLKVAYNGSILYPGFRAGVEYPIKQIAVTQYKRHGALRHFSKMRYVSAEFGYYHHPRFHDNLYLLAGWQMRKQRPRGFFTEFSPAIGYSRTFLGGETYLVTNAGNISVLHWAGYNYAMIAIGGGCGWAFSPGKSAYLRTSLLTMFPSNNLVYVRPTVELGAIWQPKHFWEARTRVLSTTKGKKS